MMRAGRERSVQNYFDMFEVLRYFPRADYPFNTTTPATAGNTDADKIPNLTVSVMEVLVQNNIIFLLVCAGYSPEHPLCRAGHS
jgi:hypothetical protein